HKPAPPRTAFLGELALDGTVRHVDGVLVAARGLSRLGYQRVFVPAADAAEAALVEDLEVIPCASLIAVVNHLLGVEPIPPSSRMIVEDAAPTPDPEHDLAEVHGQEEAKRALGAAGWRCPGRSAASTTECCSSTSWRSFRPQFCRRSASPSRQAA